jgi:hypothetical protein
VVAFAGSSFLVFAALGAMGLGAGHMPAIGRAWIAIVVLLSALALDLYSLLRRTWCPVTVRRQTPKHILLRFGARRAAIAWGLDTGLVFTTYRMSSISWALLVLDVVGVAPWWLGVGYAAGFLVPLVLGCSILRLRADPDDATGLAIALGRHTQIARGFCVATLVVALAFACAALA